MVRQPTGAPSHPPADGNMGPCFWLRPRCTCTADDSLLLAISTPLLSGHLRFVTVPRRCGREKQHPPRLSRHLPFGQYATREFGALAPSYQLLR
jgi:hypothetical protein